MGPKSSSKRGASSKKTAAGGSGLRRSAKEESSNSSFTFQMDEKDFASNFAEKTRESDEKASVSTGKVDVTEIAKTTKNVKSKRNGSKRTVAGSSEGNPYTTSMELDDVEKYSVPATITPSESAPEPMQIDEAEGAVEADLDFENQLSAADFDQVGSSIGFTFDLEKPLNAFLDQIPHSDSACVMESICKPHVLTLRRELRTSRTHQSGSPVVETLDALAELALYPRIAPLIWRHFRPLLIELVGRWRSDKSAGLMTVMNICAGCMKMAASAAPKFSASDLPTATYVPRWDGMIRHYAGLHLCSCPNTNAVIGSTQPQESKISPKHDRDGNLVQNDTTSEDHSLVPITRLELIIHALSNMFPTTPQILHHTLGILAHAPNVFEVLKPDSPHSILHSAAAELSDLRRRFTLRSAYRLLRFIPEAAWWDPKPLISEISSNEPSTKDALIARSYAAHILATISGLPDGQRDTFLEAYGSNDPGPTILEVPADEDGVWERIRLLRILEDEQDGFLRASLLVGDPLAPQESNHQSSQSLIVRGSDLSPFSVDLCGVILPTDPLPNATSTDHYSERLAMIPSTAKVLNRLGLGISLGTPILVEGPVGCGKTALIEEAAAIAGRNDLLRVHLGDQTDSKILLGSYVCTPTPGVFQWQPGILTTAVVEGRWILIEDIDLAPTEVVAVLLPLLESKTLLIASRGEKLKAKRGFQLFATRTLRTSSRGFSASSGHQQHLGENLWTTIRVRPLPVNEVHSIVRQKFPSLRPFSKTIMRAFHEMEKTYQNGISGSDSAAPGVTGRLLSLRDLMKWCGRMHSVSFQVSQKQSFPANAGDSMGAEDVHLYEREQMFREAVDTFAGMIGKRNIRDAVIMQLGLALGVSQHRVEFYLDSFNPKVDLNDLTFGRVQLGNLRSKKNQTENDRPFAMTIGAVRLLERLAVCVHLKEPVLLVGETGTGKTTCVQNLASVLGRKLVVLNLSQQSDSSDLLGGFRPVDARTLALPLKDKFDDLFSRTFNVKNNAAFIESVNKALTRKNWPMLMSGFKNAVGMAEKLKKAESKRNEPRDENDRDHENEAKRQKVSGKFANDVRLAADWSEFTEDVKQFSAQQEQLKNNVLFNFVEGALVRAVRNGDWVLLDEVNLASSETLETLSGLLQGPEGSILLLERGDTRPIHRHPDFRLFACMNPANDAGKKDLPPGLRSRFTEFWVPPPDELRGDLLMIVKRYLQSHLHLLGPRSRGDRLCESIANMYTEAKQLADSHALTDGSGGGKGGGKVHFSVRTLSRALSYAIGVAGTYGLLRGLYEGFLMTFAAHLEHDSAAKMRKLIEQCVLAEVKNVSSFINVIPPPPGTTEANEEQLNGEGYVPEDGRIQRETKTHVLFDCFWLEKGPLPIVDPAAGTGVGSYVLTQSVDQNLRNLARAVMLRRFPVLIQGPTSAGKTSMVEYLAKRTGHRFVRINNHEHTDLQEYIGTYAADSMGRLSFQEGVLVKALRNGYWIVLDELNLAPSDVLEALNRLLDDNRELVIPETQEVVRPHPSFMLFATQNPAGGQYGGRKVLSRAFRNRFMELHFGDIPESELETILERRTCIAPSYAKKIVGVFRSLRTDAIYRMKSRAHMFESGGGRGAKSFVTLRDLFRWAGRGAVGYQRLAEDGFMLISERIRRADDRELLKSCIEKEMNVVINEDGMYDVQFYRVLRILELVRMGTPIEEAKTKAEEVTSDSTGNTQLKKRKVAATNSAVESPRPSEAFLAELDTLLGEAVWTKAMKRLFTLTTLSLIYREPLLLVGDTGCGKTTVCQMLSTILGRVLHIVNAHQHSETADFLGSQRPVRQRRADADYAEWRKRAQEFVSLCSKVQNSADSKSEFTFDASSSSDTVMNKARKAFETASRQRNMGGPAEEPSTVETGTRKRLRESTDTVFKPTDAEWITITREYDYLRSTFAKGNALFEWHDGPLVNAMRNGDLFLLDEISLADDSVIERLNSVLEPQRLLVLAEKSGEGESLVEEIIAADSFHFLATMNPGGDYGKKELSPALRNRFTEIWVPSVSDRGDLEAIINKKLAKYKQLQPFGSPIIDFVEWLSERLRRASDTIISLRDILAWVVFMTANCNNLDPAMAFIHGGCMVLVDGIGVNPLLGVSMAGEGEGTEAGILRRDCLRKLSQLAQVGDLEIEQHRNREVVSDSLRFGVPPFFVEKGSVKASSDQSSFALEAPTTLKNCARVLRALQLRKPVLLEGSPGVGKTSLISKLASATHNQLTRINLSDQTDLADLFGSDLPVEEDDDVNVSRAGEFAWRDGPFLEAMKNGHWVLLDELNLAPQPVLEGLNACLDHRATVYIPELDRSFPCAPGFRVFAAQNPHSQGGGRKGLPRSFANRFTQVYVDPLQFSDLMLICSKQIHGKVRDEDREQVLLTLEKMLKFVLRVHDEVMVRRTFGWKGQPWEFNLRDALRWLELMRRTSVGHLLHPFEFLDMVFVQRMRTEEDRVRMIEIFTEIFQDLEPTVAKEKISRVDLLISPEFVRIGDALIRRNHLQFRFLENSDTCIQLLATQKRSLASVAKSVEMNWLTLLTGPSGSGKTQMVRTLARLCGRRIEEFAMNAGVDTVEILGGFEQVDNMRKQRKALEEVDKCMQLVTRVLLLAQSSAVCSQNQKVSESIMKHLEKFSELRSDYVTAALADAAKFDKSSIEMLLNALSTFVESWSLSDGNKSDFNILISRSTSAIKNCRTMLSSGRRAESQGGRFEWIDGILLKAMEEGNWVLIENVNLCPPSVLDRLNPLFESTPSLMVNERGLVDGEAHTIVPHPDFRLFMTLDPKHGEVSRAMRNRAIEIALLDPDWKSSEPDDIDLQRNDLSVMLSAVGFPGATSSRFVRELHEFDFVIQQTVHKVGGNQNHMLMTFAQMALERLHRGIGFFESIEESLEDVYGYQGVRARLEPLFAQLNQVGHAIKFASPGLWPGFQSGVSISDNSVANDPVLTGGVLMQHVAMSECQLPASLRFEPTSSSSLENQPLSRLAHVRAVVRSFVRSTSLADWRVRADFLNYFVSSLNNDDPATRNTLRGAELAMRSTFSPGVVNESSLALQSVIAEHAKTSNLLHNGEIQAYYEPFNRATVVHNHRCSISVHTDTIETVSQLSAFLKLLDLLWEITMAESEESQLLDMATFHGVGRDGPAVLQSFHYCDGRLSSSQLSHEVIKFIYPLMQHIHEGFKSSVPGLLNAGSKAALDIQRWEEILKLRSLFWLIKDDDVFDRLAVILKRLSKVFSAVTHHLSSNSVSDARGTHNVALLSSTLEEIWVTMEFNQLKSAKVLWKTGGVRAMKRKSLADSWSTLLTISDRLDILSRLHGAKPTDLLRDLYMVNQSQKSTKRAIIEAISTVFFLNEQDGSKDSVLSALRLVGDDAVQAVESSITLADEKLGLINIAEIVEGSEKRHKIHLPLQVLNEFNPHFALLSILPLQMRLMMGDQLKILSCLATDISELSEWGYIEERMQYQMQALNKVVAKSINGGFVAPGSVEPWLRLLWTFDSSNPMFLPTVERRPQFLKATWNDAVHSWFSSLWSMPDKSLQTLLQGLKGDGVAAYIQGSISESTIDGATFPLIGNGFYGIYLMRHILVDPSSIPIHFLDCKVRQLADVKQCISKPPTCLHSVLTHSSVLLLLKIIELLDVHFDKKNHNTFAQFSFIVSILRKNLENFSANPHLFARLIGENLESLNDLMKTLGSGSDVTFSPLIQSAVHYLARGLLCDDEAASTVALAKSWIYYSLGFLDSYVPLIPVDPASTPMIKLEFAKHALDTIESELLVQAETTAVRSTFTESVPQIESRAMLRKSIQSWNERLAYRPSRRCVGDLIKELQQLRSTLLSTASVLKLMTELDTSNTASERETFFQENTSSFVDSLGQKYRECRDILQPASTAVLQLKFGMRCLSLTSKKCENSPMDKVFNYLTSFVDGGHAVHELPGFVTEVQRFASSHGLALSNLNFSVILVMTRRLHAIASAHGFVTSKELAVAHALFSTAADSWALADARRLREEKEKSSLFKAQTHTFETDEELDVKELEELFPDFSDEFADIRDARELDDEASSAPDTKSKSKELLIDGQATEEEATEIRNLHSEIVSLRSTSITRGKWTDIQQCWADAFRQSYSLCREVLQYETCLPSEEFNNASRWGHIHMLANLSTELNAKEDENALQPEKTGIVGETQLFDFYHDPHVAETRRIYPILNTLDDHVGKLLTEWPDHPVLFQIVSLCTRIASFALNSPLIKLLTGLELLLQKLDDWERYASRNVSLKTNMEQLTALIIRWRQFELYSWRQLLQLEERRSSRKSSLLWFHMYRTIMRISSANDNEHGKEDLYSELLAALDQFCQSARLGDLASRLKMIKTFHSQVNILIGLSPEKPFAMKHTISAVLSNVHSYYAQFLTFAKELVEKQKVPLLKDLNDYVKIASWKDVNVFALKESATRTHHQLQKFVKRYRAALDASVNDAIEAALDVTISEDFAKSDSIMEAIVTFRELFPSRLTGLAHNSELSSVSARVAGGQRRSARLPELILKMRRMMTNGMTTIKLADDIERFDEIASEVLRRIHEFRVSSSDLQGGKPVKGQKMLRRRAWVDLIKLMEYLGVNARCLHLYRAHHTSQTIFKLPEVTVACLKGVQSPPRPPLVLHMEQGTKLKSLWQKAENYYFKLFARMQKSRATVSVVHKDVTDQEASKCESFIEHLFHMIVEERMSLSTLNEHYEQFAYISQQMKDLAGTSATSAMLSDENLPVIDRKSAILLLNQQMQMFGEFIAHSSQAIMLCDAGGFSIELGEKLTNLRNLAETSRERLSLTLSEITSVNSLVAFESGAHESLQLGMVASQELLTKTNQISSENPAATFLTHLHRHIDDSLRSIENLYNNVSVLSPLKHQSLEQKVDTAVDSCLISFQNLRSSVSDDSIRTERENGDPANFDEFGLEQKRLLHLHGHFKSIIQNVSLKSVVQSLSDVLDCPINPEQKVYLHQLSVLVQQLHIAVDSSVAEAVIWHKTLNKLAYILCNTLTSITRNGFCLPEDDGEGEENFQDDVAGVGIGEGQGKQDISKEIENEEEIEGLKNDKDGSDPQRQLPDEDNAVDVEQDFEGALEDVEANEGDEGQEDEENSKDLEEQMGDLDSSGADVVDEKMWDGENDEGNQENEKTEKDAPAAGGGEEQLVAKEDQNDGEESQAKGEDNPTADTQEQEEDGQKINDQEALQHEENHGIDMKSADEKIEGDEDMDLPDNLDLDDDGKSGDLDNADENMEDVESNEDTRVPDELEDELTQNMDVDDEEMHELGTHDLVENGQAENEDTETEPTDLQDPNEGEDAQDDEIAKENEMSEAGEQHDATASANLNEPLESMESQFPNGVDGESGQKSATSQQQEEGSNEAQGDEEPSNSEEQGGPSSSVVQFRESQSEPKSGSAKEKEPENRSLGDALKNYMSRLRNISETADSSEIQQDLGIDLNSSMEYEFVKNDEDSADTQALGDATVEQALEVGEEMKGLIDETSEYPPIPEESEREEPESLERQLQKLSNQTPHPDHCPDDDRGKTVDPGQYPPIEADHDTLDFAMETGAVGKSSEVGQDPLSELNEDGPDDLGVDPAEYERMRYSLELEVARWREEGRDSSNAQQLWRHYCELTRDLSYELCEQLRSILEPTLATKLKGDYRTGKRLNMRKVIPYIASKFKKDKIWLRRTKPSKRTYQILVSVDDSKSMSQTHSIQLAFESLSLLAKALTQLEVGELAVTSFGDTVNLLHPFEMPFTDETGGELLQKFTFLQESTRVGTMMESTLNILRSARENISGGGPSDLWQLHIIVSDGICEDHEAVRKLVRLATTELQVMVVFIVLDRREERDSIMKMSNVTYGTDRSSGKPTLQMTRYMDTFPFDNYVVLRDINGLPEVLSETLRQYFAFVSEP